MTPSNGSLPIPEQTIVGTGTYVIPANRYGHFSGTSSHTAYGYGWIGGGSSDPTNAGAGSAASNSTTQYVSEGDTITSNSSNPSGDTTTGGGQTAKRGTHGYSRILINGVVQVGAYASAGASSHTNNAVTNHAVTGHTSEQGWSVALFRIPIANLPLGAAVGD